MQKHTYVDQLCGSRMNVQRCTRDQRSANRLRPIQHRFDCSIVSTPHTHIVCISNLKINSIVDYVFSLNFSPETHTILSSAAIDFTPFPIPSFSLYRFIRSSPSHQEIFCSHITLTYSERISFIPVEIYHCKDKPIVSSDFFP